MESLKSAFNFIDFLTVQGTKVLRSNPISRLAVVGYLGMVHLYVLGIIVYWAHNFEAEHGDFGSYRHVEQLHGHPEGWKDNARESN